VGIRVLKLGGTTVADRERLHNVLAVADRTVAAGREVVLVVSALAGVTDELVTAAARARAGDAGGGGVVLRLRERHRKHLEAVLASGRGERDGAVAAEAWRVIEQGLERLALGLASVAADRGADPAAAAAVIATGERLAAPLVAAALLARRRPAVAVDAAELLVAAVGDDGVRGSFLEAQLDFAATRERLRSWHRRLPPSLVPVLTGFLAGTGDGRTALLGRGASDYSAGVVAGALEAEVLEIWTDVPGVMSADPRLVPRAATLPELGYDEVTELALLGAKVLHPRTLAPLAGLEVEVSIRDSANPGGPSTTLRPQPAGGGARAVSVVHPVSLLSLEWGPRDALAGAWTVGDDLRPGAAEGAAGGQDGVAATRQAPAAVAVSGARRRSRARSAGRAPDGVERARTPPAEDPWRAAETLLVLDQAGAPHSRTLVLRPEEADRLSRWLADPASGASTAAARFAAAADEPAGERAEGPRWKLHRRDDVALVAMLGAPVSANGLTATASRAWRSLERAGVEVLLATGTWGRSFAAVVESRSVRRAAVALHEDLLG
jgi:aspartate kinase